MSKEDSKELNACLMQECLHCKVPNHFGCKPTHHKCGISRGIKYGLYPGWAHRTAHNNIPREVLNQINNGYGNKEYVDRWG